MKCTKIKEGVECSFMTAKGCLYTSGVCHQIVGQCRGCDRATEFTSGWYCNTFAKPAMKWKNGNCNMASHVGIAATSAKTKINPLKASKRGRR